MRNGIKILIGVVFLLFPFLSSASAESGAFLVEKFRAGQPAEKISLSPLPDTREEALFVAKILGASPEKDVYLRERATEFNVKHLPLKRYQNLLFATHGLLAGEFGPNAPRSLA